MKIPNSFYIKGKTWSFRLVKDLRDENDEIVDGLTSPRERTIEVNAALTGDERMFIFWHEFTHAILKESHLSGNDGGLETIVEEVICDSVADALVPYVNFKPRKGNKK